MHHPNLLEWTSKWLFDCSHTGWNPVYSKPMRTSISIYISWWLRSLNSDNTLSIFFWLTSIEMQSILDTCKLIIFSFLFATGSSYRYDDISCFCPPTFITEILIGSPLRLMSLALENVIMLIVAPPSHKIFKLMRREVPDLTFINCRRQLLGASFSDCWYVVAINAWKVILSTWTW